jgi:molybdenum cofactor cytidylyltransferase
MGRDKALLKYRNSTFLNHILEVFLERLDPVVVVLGHNENIIRASIRTDLISGANAKKVKVVVNPQYSEGMLSSLQVGIAALPGRVNAVMFTLVDHPDVQESTLDKMLITHRKTDAQLVIPRNGGRHGHPVVATRSILHEIAKLPARASPKEVIHRNRHDTLFLDVNDTGVLRDIDTPEEYGKLL